MDDKAYNDLKIRAVLMPELARWPELKYYQWQKLHQVANEAHDRVSRACALLDEVDADRDLTPEGKIKKRAAIAERAVADFRKSTTLENARTAVSQLQARWNAKIDEAIKPAADYGQAVTYGQIRGHIAGLDEKARLAFVDKHLNDDDAVVVSAVLTAPEFLSGLTPVEIGVIRSKLARRTLDAEVFEERERVAAALAVAEGAGRVLARSLRSAQVRGR